MDAFSLCGLWLTLATTLCGVSTVQGGELNSWQMNQGGLRRESHAMASLGDGFVLVFGGVSDEGVLNSTWVRGEFRKDWHPALTRGTPYSRAYTVIASLGDGAGVMFGGYKKTQDNETLLGDTWTLSFNPVSAEVTWSQQRTSGPSPRMRHAMATSLLTFGGDDVLGAVLFGGRTNTTSMALSDETWVYVVVNSEWVRVDTSGRAGPTARCNHRMAPVSTRLVVMFGGVDAHFNAKEDTWLFNGGTLRWTRVSGSGPPARCCFGMAQISGSEAVLYGGFSGTGFLRDTWLFDSESFTWWPQLFEEEDGVPIGGMDSALAMLREGVVVLFGGMDDNEFLDQTWEFVLPSAANDSFPDGWTEVGAGLIPSERSGHAGAAGLQGAAAGSVVVFGGETSNEAMCDDTWVFTTENTPQFKYARWQQVSGEPRPAARAWHKMAPLSGSTVLLFGGTVPDAADYHQDTWVFNITSSSWTNVTDSQAPQGRELFAMANYDDGRVVIFGGDASRIVLHDTWVFDQRWHNWTQLETKGMVPGLYGHGMGMCGGVLASFGGRNEADTPTSSVYILQGGVDSPDREWKLVEPGASTQWHSPPARSDHAVVSVGAAKLAVFGGLSATGYLSDLWVLQTTATKNGEGTWSWELIATSSPPARSLAAAAALPNSSLFVFGGMFLYREFLMQDAWTIELGCVPGQFVSGESYAASVCSPCPVGTFTNVSNSWTSCDACPSKFTTTISTGSWSQASCLVCNQALCNGQPCHFDAEGTFSCLCDDHHHGEWCEKTCPGVPHHKPCYDHGQCHDGANGDGSCTCKFLYMPVSLSDNCRRPMMLLFLVPGAIFLLGGFARYAWTKRVRVLKSERRRAIQRAESLFRENEDLGSKVENLQKFLMLDLSDAEFLEVIGRGGFATVYRGIVPSVNPNRHVALKHLSLLPGDIPRGPPMFTNSDVEGLILVKGNELFVDFHGVGYKEEDGVRSLVIVTELVEGGSLHNKLLRAHTTGQPFPWSQRLQIVLDVAEGLRFLHVHGYLHGDVKSHNVLINDKGEQWRGKLADMGLMTKWEQRSREDEARTRGKRSAESERPSKEGSGGSSESPKKRAKDHYVRLPDSHSSHVLLGSLSGAPRGTLLWNAPELFREDPDGTKHTDPKVDVFAFGVTLWEVVQCTGEMPRAHLATEREIAKEILQGKPLQVDADKELAALPGILELARVCMRQNPAERPDFHIVCVRLKAIQQQLALAGKDLLPA